MVEEKLGELVTDDPSVVEASLEKFSELVCPDKGLISRSFSNIVTFSFVCNIYKALISIHNEYE